jgi:hypothetical protein
LSLKGCHRADCSDRLGLPLPSTVLSRCGRRPCLHDETFTQIPFPFQRCVTEDESKPRRIAPRSTTCGRCEKLESCMTSARRDAVAFEVFMLGLDGYQDATPASRGLVVTATF